MTMLHHLPNITQIQKFRSRVFWAAALFIALTTSAATAAPADNINVVRDLASRVGSVLGSALACPDIAKSRIRPIADKFQMVIGNASTDTERDELAHLFESSVNVGRDALAAGKLDCKAADRQLTDLEQSFSQDQGSAPSGMTDATPPPSTTTSMAAAATSMAAAATPAAAAPKAASTAQGVTDREIRFGMVAPFSGPSRDLGREMKLGIESAFARVNDTGGIAGRTLRLIPADDESNPSRTLGAMKRLYEQEQVLGFIGNVGTPTTAVAIPYVLENHILFFGAFTGSHLLRNDPPDRYIFNFRASYAEEIRAIMQYLLKMRRLQPRQIAVFAAHDTFGADDFAVATKTIRTLGLQDGGVVHLNYNRNTLDVNEAVNQLNQLKTPNQQVKAIIMVAPYRVAAKFIEKTRDAHPNVIYVNLSLVGSTHLADELMLLGPRFASGVIVTQVVPAVSGYSSAALEYKRALEKFFPGERPTYVSFEGYIAASILIEALKRTDPSLDTEKLIDTLEGMRGLDLGLGAPLNFGRDEHQASHKIWGTAINQQGKYDLLDLE